MIYSTTTHSIKSKDGLKGVIKTVADAGFPAVDISFCQEYDFVLADGYKESAREIREYAQSLGIRINQTHAPFSSYEIYTEKLVPNMSRFVEFSGLLGASQIIIHPIQRSSNHFKYAEELFRENMEFYSSLASTAKKFGVKVAIENMFNSRPVSKFIEDSACASAEEFIRYFDTLNDREAFTVCLDIGHVALCGREPEDLIYALGDRIGALHVQDVDYVNDLHTLPGFGKIDWDKVCRALAEIDYKGDFTLESTSVPARCDEEFTPIAVRFMNDVAAYYSEKIEKYKMQLKK